MRLGRTFPSRPTQRRLPVGAYRYKRRSRGQIVVVVRHYTLASAATPFEADLIVVDAKTQFHVMPWGRAVRTVFRMVNPAVLRSGPAELIRAAKRGPVQFGLPSKAARWLKARKRGLSVTPEDRPPSLQGDNRCLTKHVLANTVF